MAEAEVSQQRLTADEARARADECRAMTKRGMNPDHRTMLVHMAETWDRIAADMDRHNT
jgi:hypothetical protein